MPDTQPLLKFYVADDFPSGAPALAALLKPDKWDDYGYKTSFDLELRNDKLEILPIGPVKILARRYETDRLSTRSVIHKQFVALDPERYCSLGQASNYYARLAQLQQAGWPSGLAQHILGALGDVCFASEKSSRWWEAERSGFQTSLLRYADAHIARREAAVLLAGHEAGEDNVHSFALSDVALRIHVEPKHAQFLFDATRAIPSRINVLVGRNGAGKSALLQGLASCLTGEGTSREGYVPQFSRVVYVSFNAFDASVGRLALWERSALRFVGYKPGNLELLGKLVEAAQTSMADNGQVEEWHNLLVETFKEPQRWIKAVPYETQYQNALVDLVKDPDWVGFIRTALDNDELGEALGSDPASALHAMSPGQRILAALYAGLFINLDRRALVLIDEPENHLHPSMLASFIRHLAQLLQNRRAFAIVVTHSPIVLQETPSRDVWVMTRTGDVSSLARPHWETFGDSVDNITQYLFETDFKSSNWKSQLQRCVDEGQTGQMVEAELGGRELPLLARTYIERARLGRKK